MLAYALGSCNSHKQQQLRSHILYASCSHNASTCAHAHIASCHRCLLGGKLHDHEGTVKDSCILQNPYLAGAFMQVIPKLFSVEFDTLKTPCRYFAHWSVC